MGGKFPRKSAELAPILARHRLDLVSGWYDGRINEREIDAELEAVLPHLTLLRDMGCRYVVYADTSAAARTATCSRRSRAGHASQTATGRTMAASITRLAERMAEFGVGMAFHHHMGTIVETDEEVGRLMAATGEAVGLLFDTGHSLFSGGDPVALLKRHVGRVVHVHCKDVRRDVFQKARATDDELHAGGARRRLHHARRRLRRFPRGARHPL